jgi:phosphohistidine swiveling domain-containing protein
MIDSTDVKNKSIEWKRINMRSVAHLMGVEFIHDLYNRHEPKINSIRFRHTITVWKDGIVNSYAPVYEWIKLGEILGDQYFSLDQLLIESTKKLYQRKRKYFHAFIKNLHRTKLSGLSNKELASLLIRFQSITLGELYVLNFVQVEHSLNIAVRKIISEMEPNKQKAENLFVRLIQTEKSSSSQKEKSELYRIVRKWKWLKNFSLFSEQKAKEDIGRHHEKYKYLYSAYGEDPADFEVFWADFQKFLSNEIKSPKITIFPKLLSKESRNLLRGLNSKKLNILVPLLVRGGLFRDTNKALLGQSIKYRFDMLNEITRRNLESRGNLNFYLLAEITDLLYHSKKLDEKEIVKRKSDGVTFTRFEDFKIHTSDVLPLQVERPRQKIFRGQCASPGICLGKCKIVLTKEDGNKVRQGDIMIAIGTDFDLIEAMYRSAAVVTEEGGILSHASVVCREIGKPCCIGVKNATKILTDGQLIKVDASKGMIFIIE